MSCVEIYVVRNTGCVEYYGEASNAFGGAMHIWLALKGKYQTGGRLLEGFEILWKAIGTMHVPDQWVLASTFDGVIIPKEHLAVFLGHFSSFYALHPNETLQQEHALLTRALHDDAVYGVCFNQTSVNSNPWCVYEEDEGRPYNVQHDTEHFYLTPEYLERLRTDEFSENTEKKH